MFNNVWWVRTATRAAPCNTFTAMMFYKCLLVADGHKGRTLQSVRRSIWELKVAMLSAEGSGPPGSGPPGSGPPGNVPGRAAALSGLTMIRP